MFFGQTDLLLSAGHDPQGKETDISWKTILKQILEKKCDHVDWTQVVHPMAVFCDDGNGSSASIKAGNFLYYPTSTLHGVTTQKTLTLVISEDST
jgi:hypothetical protein